MNFSWHWCGCSRAPGFNEQMESLHELLFFRNCASRFSREGTLELWNTLTKASTDLYQFRLQYNLGNYTLASQFSSCSPRTFIFCCCSVRFYSQTSLTRSGVTAATGAFLLQSKTFTFKNCSRNINSSGLRAALHLGPVTALSLYRDVELKPLSTKAFAFCLFLPFSHFPRNDTAQTGRDFFDISLAKEKQRQVQSLQEDPWQLQKHPRLAAARVQCSHHALSLFTALLKSRGLFVLSAKQKS